MEELHDQGGGWFSWCKPEWTVIRQAPRAFAVSVIAICVLIGCGLYWVFKANIDLKNDLITSLRDDQQRLKSEIDKLKSENKNVEYQPQNTKLILKWGSRASACNIAIDSSLLLKFKDQFGVAFTCHLVSTDIDEYETKRISVSQIFSIRPDVIEMQAMHRKEMIDEINHRAEIEKKTRIPQEVAIKNHILLLPKNVNTDEIRKLSDVPHFGGRILMDGDLIN